VLREGESKESKRMIKRKPTSINIPCSQGKVINPDTYQANTHANESESDAYCCVRGHCGQT
jgi:hypothetical protein